MKKKMQTRKFLVTLYYSETPRRGLSAETLKMGPSQPIMESLRQSVRDIIEKDEKVTVRVVK